MPDHRSTETPDYRLVIDRMIMRGESFETIEAYLDGLDIDDEERGRLWLLAFCETEPHVRRRLIASMN